MMAVTHAAVGVVAFGGAIALSGGRPEPLALGAAALGSLLPDVDTPTSRVGWVLSPLASWLEARYGHRTITHSLTGVLIFALIISPLLLVASLRPLFSPLLVGYILHLFGDSATKAGVPLAWPRPERFVFPGNEALRFRTGSPAELVFLGVVVCLGALVAPVASAGPRQVLHALIGTPAGAIRDVEDFGDRFECAIEVRGVDEQQQRVVSGTWPLIGRRLDTSLLVERDGRQWVIGRREAGSSEMWRISPRYVRVHRLRPASWKVTTLHCSNLSFAALCRLIPAPSARISGEVECYPWREAPAETPLLGAKSVRVAGQKVIFDLATPAQIREASAQAVIKSGTVTLRLPENASPPALEGPQRRAVVVAGPMARRVDFRLAPGDILRRGEPLAAQGVEELGARELLRGEEAALRGSALWPELSGSMAARRRSLLRRSAGAPVPWDAVIEAVEWEPPVLAEGARPQHVALVTLSEIRP